MTEDPKRVRPNTFYSAQSRPHVVSLKVANFKIFRAETLIGPFEDFTAIVGANGSGKSTTLDAFAFCLLKDQIVDTKKYEYANVAAKSTAKNPPPAEVTVRVETDTSALEFTRQLMPDSSSRYLVNGREVALEEYEETLEAHHLFGFSVMSQEELTTFTSKTPKELMRLFEKVAGSDRYRGPYETLQKEIDGLHKDVLERNEQLRTAKREKKFALSLIEGSELATDLFAKLERAEKDVLNFTLLDFHKELEQVRTQIVAAQDDLALKNKQFEEKSNQIMQHNTDLGSKNALKNLEERRSKKIELLREKEAARKRVKAIEKRLAELGSEKLESESAIGKARGQLENFQTKVADLEAQLQGVKSEKERLGELKGSKFAKMGASLRNLDELTRGLGTHELEKEAFQSSLKAAGSETEAARTKLEAIVAQRKEADRILDAETAELKRLAEERREAEEKLADLDAKMKQVEKRKSVQTAELQRKANMESELDVLRIRLNQLTLEAQQSREEAPLANTISSVVEGVHGELSDLIQVTNPKFAVAVGVALLPVLDSVVVPDQKTADRVSDFLKSRQQMKNVIILDSPVLTDEATSGRLAELRALIGPRGLVAADALTASKSIPRLKEFITHFLEGVVICDNLKSAFQLQKAYAGRLKKVVTADGVRLKGTDIDDLGARKNYPKKLRNFLLRHEGLDEREVRQRRKTADMEQLMRDKQEVQERVEELEAKLKAVRFAQIDAVEATEDKERQERQLRKDLGSLKSAIEIANHRLAVAQNRLWEVKDEENKGGEVLKAGEKTLGQFTAKLKAIDDKIAHLKRDFLAKNKATLKSAEELENVIAASKNVEKETLKANARLHELQIQLSLIPVEAAKKELQMAEEALAERRKLEEGLREEVLGAERHAEALEMEVAAVVGEIQAMEANLREQEKEVASLGKQVKLLEAEIQTLTARKRELYDIRERLRFNRVTFVEDTELRGMVIDDSLKQTLAKRRPTRRRSDSLRHSRDLDDEDDFEFDYTKVARSVDRASERDLTLEEVKKHVLESVKRRDDIKARLKDMTTNVQNEAVITAERDKIGRLTTDIERLQKEIADKLVRQKEASEEFDGIAEKRRQRLMSLVELMQSRIGFIFKTLCMDERASAGFLLENTYIPFLDGIIFNATPPAKKFTIGTEGLSSGEASMANVALFLCFNDIKRSSMVLFDEIDAHMDAENVFRLVNTLGKSARIAQVVVVSHKPFLYSRGQVLLGITKHPTKDSSTCYSHRLRPKAAAERV